MSISADIKENAIVHTDKVLLELLLIDRSRSTEDEVHNILWATDNYLHYGEGYAIDDEISIDSITGENGLILRPRVNKSKAEQEYRSRDKAEVFTPAWICNSQNNLIDKAWFGTESPFNVETENSWITNQDKITFPEGKEWTEYVNDTRLEITCGEAPYLASRYNVVTGEEIQVKDRIGIIDRKLRVVSENCEDEKTWIEWAIKAYKATYGFEWQGDNLLLAREALLYTFIDYFEDKFERKPSKAQTRKVAEIISWNLWQMDGLKGVIPGTCHEKVTQEVSLFGDIDESVEKCKGCETNDIYKHNGVYCKIKDWKARRTIRFVDLLNK
jgi:hypothetical protein